ncbi:MAG TPA: 3-isopropylmalate dehydratase large subunit [Alphaproteobacteria bacterium]|nr:3-isopropylmalate dehydratase large subunit [Alphaproteobacteria bacterium]
MGLTLAEKIIARAAGTVSVAPGDLVTVRVDLAMAHDSSGPRRWRPRLEELGAGLWDPERVVIVSDHYVPAVDLASAEILQGVRKFVADYGVRHFYDMQGICHVILPEHGHLKPGMLVAGGDSHSPTGGAFGCYMAGFGATDMLGIVVTGETWMDVPHTIRVDWNGAFTSGVTAKDIMLFLCRALGMDNASRVIEYGGSTIEAMEMEQRMVLCNMAAELGADTGIIAPDAKTLAHIRAHGGEVEDDALDWRSDEDARYLGRHAFDAAALAPQVAAPHSPANSAPAVDHAGIRIDQAYIGACVGAKLDDLTMAAEILRGRKIAPGVRLLVAPASTMVTRAASETGVLGALLEAGAVLLPSGCGACAGMGAGLLADGDVCISTTNRNFKGRMGNPGASVYLASPYSVAAAAVAGHIVDPREMLAERAGRA